MTLSWPDVDSLGLLPSDVCFIWCFVSTCKSPSSNSVYKIPCKNYLREISMTAAYHHTGVFSIKNPTIESEVSWSSLLSLYTLEEQSFQHCENFTLDFKQHGLCAYPLFLQTLGPWFPNEMQNLLSSEKRTLDHWGKVQFLFSLPQVRCFGRCCCFRSGLVAFFLKISERRDSWCTDSSFSSLLVKHSQVFESVSAAWEYS